MATQYTAGLSTGQVLTAATMNSIGAAWETWTPTVTSSGGTLGSTTASGKYSRVNKLITCTFDILITAVGTGAGSLVFTLPLTAVTATNGGAWGTWRERAVTGELGFVNRADSAKAFCDKYDATAILNTGRHFIGTFTYEAA